MEIEDKYDLIKVVGEGSFGIVHKAIDRSTHEIVALKELKYACPSEYVPEIRALTALEHPTIVGLKDVVHTADGTVFLALEYMKCSLGDYIFQRRQAGNPFSEAEIRSLSLQMFTALDFMHREGGYMHRDLKPQNLLVNEKGVLKISDLGTAIEIDPCGHMFGDHVGTMYYEAPELLVESSYDDKVDMWAAGLVLTDMFLMFPMCMGDDLADQLYLMRQVLGNPTCNSTIGKMIQAKLVHKPQLEDGEGVGFRAVLPGASHYAIDLIQSLCSWEPYKRPSAAQALKHPFFTCANNVAGFSCAIPSSNSFSVIHPIC